jgi:diguanylate cyclase (GGDEF)-like protein
MTASVSLFMLGDTAWAVINRVGFEPSDAGYHLLAMTFLLAYALFGAAVLHPSVRKVSEEAAPRGAALSPQLLGLLAGASLIAPGILAIQVARNHVTDGGAIVIGSVALFLLVITRMAQLLRQLEGQSQQLRELARVDVLTGLPNRRAWSEDMPAAIERARRDDVPVSIAMIDLDHFKKFNDEYGHVAGDRLLKGASAAWRAQLRAVDGLARYGGEEFIALFPSAEWPATAAVLERLLGVTPAKQTFSAGVATWDRTETSDELIARADAALYIAKRTGRNRIVRAVEPDLPDHLPTATPGRSGASST